MKTSSSMALAGAMILTGGLAQAADPAQGEADFKRCRSCHEVVADNGTAIVKGGKTGPNLYGVVGRTVASVEDFRYSESLEEVGESGVVWDEEPCGLRRGPDGLA